MARRLIEFDEETDRMLAEIAKSFDGDISKALTEMVRTHEERESFVDACENMHRSELIAQINCTEEDFRQGRYTTWDDIKRRNGL